MRNLSRWLFASALLLAGLGPGPAAADDKEVERLFATTCGWCHEDGGRRAGKGPQLMGSTRSDDYLINRIATGRPGRMPAFGHALSLEQIEAIVRYIRNLEPREVGG